VASSAAARAVGESFDKRPIPVQTPPRLKPFRASVFANNLNNGFSLAHSKININLNINFMKTISMLDLRLHSREMIRRLRRGETLRLTYRNQRIATLIPESEPVAAADDPIRNLCKLAEPGLTPMTNEQIDQLLYGEPQDIH
jgi:antitoxin (DNA-binding transcriptional repressor) of toxin-antitoxin stability system